MTQKIAASRFDAPVAASPEEGARLGQVREGATRGRTVVEALRDLGSTRIGDRDFDLVALEIGEQIRNARQRAGLTQAELAESARCKQGDISNIELGKGRDGPTYRVLRAISQALGEALSIGPLRLDDQVDVLTEAANCVVQAKGSIREYAPLLSHRHWAHLRDYVAQRSLPPPSLERGYGALCTLVTLEPTTKATLRVQRASEALVVATVWGTGSCHVRGALHRKSGPVKAGSPVGLVQAGAAVELASADEPLSVMMVPAGVLIGKPVLEDACE